MAGRRAFPLLGRWIIVLGLVEQEVGSELLVHVAGEVCLDGLIAVEAKAAQLFIVSLTLNFNH